MKFGLAINTVIVWLRAAVFIPSSLSLTNPQKYQIIADASKIIGAAVVMVWNFVIRKIFLDSTPLTQRGNFLVRCFCIARNPKLPLFFQ